MASITNIPNEMLDGVVQEIGPDDLRNLSLTSHHFRGLLATYAAQDKLLRDLYNTVKHEPADLLYAILEKPRLAYFAKRLHIIIPEYPLSLDLWEHYPSCKCFVQEIEPQKHAQDESISGRFIFHYSRLS